MQYCLVLRTRKLAVQQTKPLCWLQHTRPLLVCACSLALVPFPLKLLLGGLSRLPPIRLKSEAELENQKNPKASQVLKDHPKPDDGSAPPHDARPPPVIDSPDSETRIVVDSPVAYAERTASSASNAPATLSHATQQGYLASYDPPPVQATTPPVTMRSRSSSPTPVSGDIILPLMIFSVVKANPSHFVSHLLYTQRFRNQRVGGEESYCLVNLMAVADFLENVDLKALGLGESEKKVTRFVRLSEHLPRLMPFLALPI